MRCVAYHSQPARPAVAGTAIAIAIACTVAIAGTVAIAIAGTVAGIARGWRAVRSVTTRAGAAPEHRRLVDTFEATRR